MAQLWALMVYGGLLVRAASELVWGEGPDLACDDTDEDEPWTFAERLYELLMHLLVLGYWLASVVLVRAWEDGWGA